MIFTALKVIATLEPNPKMFPESSATNANFTKANNTQLFRSGFTSSHFQPNKLLPGGPFRPVCGVGGGGGFAIAPYAPLCLRACISTFVDQTHIQRTRPRRKRFFQNWSSSVYPTTDSLLMF